MTLTVLTLGAYQVNTYILSAGARDCKCLVIDPGYDADTILEKLDEYGLELEAIVLTHGHFDHVGAVKELVAETGCAVYIHGAENTMPPMLTAGKLYYTNTYDEGDALTLAGLNFTVLHTPGHTPGSVCLAFPCGNLTVLFSGDTLFQGSCGRVDLPGGDMRQMYQSLKRLGSLKGNYRIYPGHGGDTTLREELFHNPYLGGSPYEGDEI